MAATALAQRAARPASAPARRPRRQEQPRPRPRLQPVRTASAIGGAADSRLIVRLTRSQAWIAIVGVLLTGIVALNVYSLSMGSVVSATAERASVLERENSLLREQIGKLRKNGEIERFAAKLGLGQPTSEQLVRVEAGKNDAARAAARLEGIGASAPVLASTSTAEPAAPLIEETVVDPAAAAETVPVAPVAEPEPVATETSPAATETEVAAAEPVADPAAAGGIAP